LNFRAE